MASAILSHIEAEVTKDRALADVLSEFAPKPASDLVPLLARWLEVFRRRVAQGQRQQVQRPLASEALLVGASASIPPGRGSQSVQHRLPSRPYPLLDELEDVPGLHFGVLLEQDLLHLGQEALMAGSHVLGAAPAGSVPEFGGFHGRILP